MNEHHSPPDPVVRTPDGKIDTVQTALNKMRAEAGMKSKTDPSSLREMTEWLKTHEIDSPRATWKDWVQQEWWKICDLWGSVKFAASEIWFLITRPAQLRRRLRAEREAWKKLGKQDERTFIETGRSYGPPRRLVWVENILSAFWFLVAVVVFCVIAGVFRWFFSIK